MTAFMPYYPLGYPTPEVSLNVIEALARGGADSIEVGVPFSDPLADGPVVQRATQIALEQGMTLARAIEGVAELRARGVKIPLVLMGYYNPLLAYGLERLARASAGAAVSGFIVPDLPPEEAADLETALAGAPGETRIDLIRMLAPTTPSERAARILRDARGFVYLVSLTGVTGARSELPPGLPEFVARVRQQAPAGLPLCVGFGISTPEQGAAVGRIADGIIVGSACVKTVGEAKDPVRTAEDFDRAFKSALQA